MFSHYVIEADEHQAGLVILEQAGFRFYAAHPGFAELEGRVFRSALDATRAAEAVAEGRPRVAKHAGPVPMPPHGGFDGRVSASLLM